ncbi:hypothetical protein BU17DRAFT_61260 [Hysterangium stoloniferum]|nr:hypothetical protein BU17DRAFT_61260 [Hysterangium stoloniferum]
MADYDEFDALLEGPFAEDVDWSTIEGMASLPVPVETTLSGVSNLPASHSSTVHALRLSPRASTLDEAQSTQPAPVSNWSLSTSSSRTSASFRLLQDIMHNGGERPAGFTTTPGSLLPTPAISNAFSSNSGRNDSGTAPYCPDATLVPSHRTSQPGSSRSKLHHMASYGCLSQESPRKKPRRGALQTTSLIDAVGRALECAICFDVIVKTNADELSRAAAHTLSCGHTACAVCLHEWLAAAEDNGDSRATEAWEEWKRRTA